jgi:L,D-peptidoglycan transpeptidase YkuD (ErfK/YbiS/YcfS/YnhG family)
MRRATRFGAALASALAALATTVSTAPATPADAASVPRATAAAAALAPAVPGARRFTGQITADVRQVIVVSATSWRSTVGTARLYARVAGGRWHIVATYSARLGYGGLVAGTRRVQGTGTTPAGNYSMTTAFGIQANPGTSLPYTRVDDDQWWVEDRTSRYYNQMRRASLGGFHVTTAGYNGSEHLARMGSQYDHVVVIDFNMHPVVGRGAGIFLHAFGRGATAGCVALPYRSMTATMRWLKASLHPRIIIGPASWLNA